MPEDVVIGVDLGGTNIRAARVGKTGIEGEIMAGTIRKGAEPDEITRAVADAISTAVAGRSIRAVGIGVPGTVSDDGIVRSGNLGWDGYHFGLALGMMLKPTHDVDGSFTITVVNDLHATALAEARFGRAQLSKVVLCVSVGTGIGSKLIIGDDVYTGGSGFAGEIGHIRMDLGERNCVCGARGCLEAYAGGKAIEERYHTETGVGKSCSEIDTAATRGDRNARRVMDVASVMLAQGLGIATTLLNPDVLVLGGGVWLNCPHLRSLVLDRIGAMSLRQSYDSCRILTSALHHGGKSYAGILGAAVATGGLD